MTLKDPEDYDPAYKRWSLDALPLYFPDWGQKPNEQSGGHTSKKERLKQIGTLLKNCEYVIHAGDPDDEGQYLIDEILRWHRYRGSVWRMNTNDTTPASLSRALQNLTDNRESESRGWSVHARSVADMMVGYNCSRYFTLKNPGVLLTIGRVQTVTLGFVAMRDAAIEGHTKQLYYEVTAILALDGQTVEAKYEPKKGDKAANLEESGTGPLSAVPPGTYIADVTGTRIDEKQTKPPARYTKASLGKDMTRIARYVANPEVKKLLLAKDRDLEMIRHVLQTEYPHIDMATVPAGLRRGGQGSEREVLGLCPRCGGAVVEGKAGFGCSNYKAGCKFVVWKKSKMPMMAKITISKTCVKSWLSGAWRESENGVRISAKGVTFKCLTARSGNAFTGTLYLEDDPNSPYGLSFRVVLPKQDKDGRRQERKNVRN